MMWLRLRKIDKIGHIKYSTNSLHEEGLYVTVFGHVRTVADRWVFIYTCPLDKCNYFRVSIAELCGCLLDTCMRHEVVWWLDTYMCRGVMW